MNVRTSVALTDGEIVCHFTFGKCEFRCAPVMLQPFTTVKDGNFALANPI